VAFFAFDALAGYLVIQDFLEKFTYPFRLKIFNRASRGVTFLISKKRPFGKTTL
jgi:hypothetical protein